MVKHRPKNITVGRDLRGCLIQSFDVTDGKAEAQISGHREDLGKAMW